MGVQDLGVKKRRKLEWCLMVEHEAFGEIHPGALIPTESVVIDRGGGGLVSAEFMESR